jgi:hypothetical protein
MIEQTLWVPKTEEEKDQVRRQMNRLLATTHFKNSRRYPALFRFIVEETLEGRGEFLKERLLGVRVFNRPPDYDTADDPIVRVTIAEIRKRIAQYYHEEAHETEMRIELLSGHYVPEFHPSRLRMLPQNGSSHSGAGTIAPDSESHEANALADDSGLSAPEERPRIRLLSRLKRYQIVAAALTALLLVAGGSIALWQWTHPSAIDEFWRPFLVSRHTVIFCLPTDAAGSHVAEAAGIISSTSPGPRERSDPPASRADSPTFLDHETEGENVVFSDALAMQKISNWLASQGIDSRLRLNALTTLDDLQQGPTVLIGGLDNNWTLRAVSRLRYRFSGSNQQQYWIVDSKNPNNKDWFVDLEKRYPAVQRDYALIARFHDESTRQVQVVVAGIGMSGTASAGKFLVDPNLLKELRRRVGPGFRDHDFEAVLGLDVVNGVGGSPQILAVEVW